MCGIAGFVSSEGAEGGPGHEALLDAMCRAIAHRGPDDQGTWIEDRAALGMRRLSIIDIATGQQPIFSEEERFAIVFNGEIYNYRELRKELETAGYRFRTNSDTETILHAFEKYGTGCVNRLRGMFAFAIWDARERSLFMARDRIGKKPLFYSLTNKGTFVFGSELKSLLIHPEVNREIDPAAIDAYLAFGYVPESLSIFRNVHKLPPAHTLEYRSGSVSTARYWYIPDEPFVGRSEEDISEELQERLSEAVKIRLISEVPLGAFLSGGIDSSAVVGMMAGLSEEPVKTFSIGFNEDSFSELRYARIAAKHFRTDHHEFIVTPDLVEIVDDIVWHFDEPFADPSSLPTYMVAKMAREYVTVVLSGDGGDELFGGYTRYLTGLSRSWAAAMPDMLRNLIGKLSTALPHSAPGRNYLYNISLDQLGRYIDLVSHFNLQRRRELYSPEMRETLDGTFGRAEEEFCSLAGPTNTSDMISPMLRLDTKTYLPSDVMVKVDRMTMANSLEARAPLLDHELVEFAARIPAEMKIKDRETKYIMKRALEGAIPHEILYREKQGFGVPIEEWINRELRDRIRDTLLDGRAIQRGYFDRRHIEMLLMEHADRRRDHSYSLWALFMLELWHRRYVDIGAF